MLRLALVLFCCYTNYLYAQIPVTLRPADAAKALLVGSWHFSYPNLDAHKTEEKFEVNFKDQLRKRELDSLLDYLARFRPTHIFVESGRNTGYLMYNYREWKAGAAQLYTNERSLVGVQLAMRLGLDTVYGVDDWPLLDQLQETSKLKKIPYLNQLYQNFSYGGTGYWADQYSVWYRLQDSLIATRSILESFQHLNQPEYLETMLGAYLVSPHFLESEAKMGADALSMTWLNRNLRIYQNIRRVAHEPGSRILVLFGAGHIPILRWLFQSSPEFRLVEFDALGK